MNVDCLIAEHLEAAGDPRAAYAWHMRAGAWSNNRDIRAARISWDRACRVADALPSTDPERTATRIRPRMALCTRIWRAGLGVADTGFDELRGLCYSVGDDVSLAIAMYGQVVALSFEHRHREASVLASEQIRLLEESPDALRGVVVIHGPVLAKVLAGEVCRGISVSAVVDRLGRQRPGEGQDRNFRFTTGSVVVPSRAGRMQLGPSELAQRHAKRHRHAALCRRTRGGPAVAYQQRLCRRHFDRGAARRRRRGAETTEAARIAEERGDDVALEFAHIAHGLVLSRRPKAAERALALELLRKARDHLGGRNLVTATMADIRIAELTAQAGEVQGAIESARCIVDQLVENGEMLLRATATAALVETLLRRGSDADMQEAAAAIERLAAVPTDPGFVLNDIWLLRLRALLARAHGDEAAYRDYRDRYRAMATSLGFEGHMKWAVAMP